MKPRYRVTLTEQERSFLDGLTRRGTHNARTTILARALLLCDAGPDGPAWTSAKIVDALGITSRTMEHLKKRFVEEGLEVSIHRKAREKPPREVRLDGKFEARLIALACSEAPAGYSRWTVRLLSEKIVELQIAESVSHMSVHRILKKMNINLTLKNIGKFPPKKMQPL
jgi:hypothetical protein